MTDPTTSPLFTPITLGDVTLANRVVMAPMTRNRAGAGNVPTAMMVEYYLQRATGGLLITEGAQVVPEGQGYPGTPGIHSDTQVAGWRAVTDAVHAAGGRMALQLWHVGRISHPTLQPGARRRWRRRPSGPRAGLHRHRNAALRHPARARDRRDPRRHRGLRGGARHAMAAGFDLVEIHAANGYLVAQFLRSGTNHRTDQYGGSLENRLRFLVEVVSAVAGAVGAGRVGVRLSPTSGFNDMSDADPVATFTAAAAALRPLGLAYLHVIRPIGESWRTPAAGPGSPRRSRRPSAARSQANGGYGAESAAVVLGRGEADLVSFGTTFLANPDLPERLRSGAPLNAPDPASFYGGDARGYIDYPALAAV
ncbi:MAG: alkene reductase [Gemmatimonadetes bacterium]|nr:alkene reductase [Gemmatimonadota bacterium]